MTREKALKAYSYNGKVFLARKEETRKLLLNLVEDSDYNERLYEKAVGLISTICLKIVLLENNPIVSPKGDFASFLTKSILDSNLEEKEKVDLIYHLELNMSHNKYKEFNSSNNLKKEFYEIAIDFNKKTMEVMNEKENVQLKMLLDNILKNFKEV